MGWNGAGGWLIFSHDRQVNFSRTVWITFHWRGTTSSVSVMSSPSFASLPPQHGHSEGADTTNALARQMRRQGGTHRPAPHEAAHDCAARLLGSRFGSVFILRRARLEILELQLQLIEKLRALGRWAEAFALQRGDQ